MPTDFTCKIPQGRKVRACHKLVSTALINGSLIKLPCGVCGELRTEAHHDDYDKPLDVRWLCRSCHLAHHVNARKPPSTQPGGRENLPVCLAIDNLNH